MSKPGLITAPFAITVPGLGRVKGKAVRNGQLWTLVADGYAHLAQTGYDLVKAQKALELRLRPLGEKAKAS